MTNTTPPKLQEEIDRATKGGLDRMTTRERFGALLDSLFLAERSAYLDEADEDKGNGAYDRRVNVGSLPVDVEVREADRRRPYGVHVAVGLGRDGTKRVVACQLAAGRESLEAWETLLRSLIERGLRNLMIVVHDDFSGLLAVTKSLFPTADVQLCVVHMQRNAKSHLGKDLAAKFNSRMRTIKGAWSRDLAARSDALWWDSVASPADQPFRRPMPARSASS